MKKKISMAVDDIIDDLSDRRGLRQEIDEFIKKEIRDAWIKIISKYLDKE